MDAVLLGQSGYKGKGAFLTRGEKDYIMYLDMRISTYNLTPEVNYAEFD